MTFHRLALHRRELLQAAATLAASALPHRALAQTYPARPIRMVVNVAAGGPSDVIARLLGQKLSERWGQTLVIENVPTGAGNVGTVMVAKAPPDGYTVLVPSSSFVVNPSLYAKPPYDPVTDLAPVTVVAASSHVLVVHPSLAARTVPELIALVKSNPGKFSYASPGTGTTGQLAGELFKLSLGLDLVHVPFNGAGPAIISTIGGHTPIAFLALPGVAPNIREGTVRALAITAAKRSSAFPDVPTLKELGYPEQESDFPQVVLAPPGTPREIVDLWQREIVKIVAMPDVKERLASISFEPIANTPDEFTVWMKAEIAKWEKVIADARIAKIQ
jgi:tripartite-type tricarboxylate transporter receptor subunit TctC